MAASWTEKKGVADAVRDLSAALSSVGAAMSGATILTGFEDEWASKMSPDEFDARCRARRRARQVRAAAWVYVAALLLWTFVIFAAVWGVMR
jgi:hypothetical protein